MRRTVLAAMAGAIAALMVTACTPGGSDSGKFEFRSANKLGTTIPLAQRKPTNNFTGPLLGGGTTSLAQYAGKVTLVNFWAQWCVPCSIETPQLDLVYREDESKGVQILGVDTKDDSGAAKSFVKNNHISFPMVSDEEGRIALLLGNVPASGLPFSVLLDKHQRVAAVYLGPVSPKDLQPVLTKLESEV